MGSEFDPASDILPKQQRVALILARMLEAPFAASREEALAMIAGIFQEVEDLYSGVLPPHRDRLYPPVEDMAREVEGMPSLRRYRHTNHYTLIADNGAILIRGFIRGEVSGIMKITGERTMLDKPGADGVHIPSGE